MNPSMPRKGVRIGTGILVAGVDLAHFTGMEGLSTMRFTHIEVASR